MSEVLISPGILTRENDQSQVSAQPAIVGAAIIGPTVKGPVEDPKIVTSYSEYQNKFGTTFISGSDIFTYFTSIAAYNYFNNGGDSLLVARVASGTFTAATTLTSSGTPIICSSASAEVFVLETISEGIIMNNTGSQDISGSLISGSADNVRWQISNVESASGQFSLLVRRGNDNRNNPVILETFTNLSLDPKSTNFISKVIGDQVQNYNSTTNQMEISGSYPNNSKYIRVANVRILTPDYLDNTGNFKAAYTSSLPINTSGSFGGALGSVSTTGQFYDGITDGNRSQGIPSSSYSNMVSLLSNKDDFQFNVLLTPGLFNSLHSSVCTSIISNTQERGDNIYVLDLVPYNVNTISSVTAQSNARNTSYAASYWPWVQVIDPDSGKNVWVPSSTVIGGVYAYNDSVSETWSAPAGINRGGLNTVIRAMQKLPQSDRDTLYQNKINPIATFPGVGIVVYGQKTLQTQASALDRINVRRLLITLKRFIGGVAQGLVFEGNTIATRNSFLSQVNPYLESVQQRNGLYASKVIMDDTNNGASDVIDQNKLVGQIYISPTKTSEFIYLDFTITPTGATFG